MLNTEAKDIPTLKRLESEGSNSVFSCQENRLGQMHDGKFEIHISKAKTFRLKLSIQFD